MVIQAAIGILALALTRNVSKRNQTLVLLEKSLIAMDENSGGGGHSPFPLEFEKDHVIR